MFLIHHEEIIHVLWLQRFGCVDGGATMTADHLFPVRDLTVNWMFLVQFEPLTLLFSPSHGHSP
jgi:hypothetical protein